MAAGMAVVFTPTAAAAVVRPLAEVYDEVVYGDFIQIGNGNMRCPDVGDPVDPTTGVPIADCPPTQARVAEAGRVNDAFYMNWADVDADAATFNSSSGSVVVPAGATVEFALLNWAGDTGTFRNPDGTISATPACDVRESTGIPVAAVPPPGTPESTPVQLDVGAGPSTAVAPATISRDPLATVGNGTAQYYTASADVTAQLAAAATGGPVAITVGNVWSPEGFGCFAGWSLTLVYAYDEPDAVFAPVARQVIVHDGHVRQEPDAVDVPTVVTVAGIAAIEDDARVGVTAFEGDFNIGGDTLAINGTPVAEPFAGGTTTNFFTSDAQGELLPTVPNNLSVDAKAFDTALIPAGSTTADFTFDTTADDFLLAGLAVSVAAASIDIEKTVVDDGPYRPGELVQFEITVVKPGGAAASDVVITDPTAPGCDRTSTVLEADTPLVYLCSGPAPATSGDNVVTVTALDEFGAPITDTDAAAIEVINPAIAITKVADQPQYDPGDVITFTITVENTGDAVLTGVTVTDPELLDCNALIGTLLPGEFDTYDCTTIAPVPGDDNTVTVVGVDPAGGTVTASATAAVPTVGSVSGQVFADRDNNGVFEPLEGDTGIAGVTVTLFGTTAAGAPLVLTEVTAPTGDYAFAGVPAGTYTLVEAQPAAFDDGVDTPGENAAPAGNDTFVITMPQGGTSTGNDFAELATSSLAGIVYEDLNGDGAFDAGEPGIPGATVTVSGLDEQDNAVNLTAITGATGNYDFPRLRAGTYTITETQPAGYLDGDESVGSLGGVEGDDAISAITVPARAAGDGYDFGELLASSLSGVVVDEDGAGIPGVTISLDGVTGGGLPFSATATTDAGGVWVFADLPPGTYSITETQPAGYGDGPETVGSAGGTLVLPDTISDITIGSDTVGTGYVFAEVAGSVAGSVYEDADNDGQFDVGEVPIAGVTVTLTGTDVTGDPVSLTTTTDGAGAYLFEGVLAGEYTVTETQPVDRLDGIDTPGSQGGVATEPDSITFTLPAGVDAVGYLFGELVATGLAGSVVDDQGNPIAGVVITLQGVDDQGDPVADVTVTDAQGAWSFLDLRPGAYTVTETQPEGYGDGPETVGTAGGTAANDVFAVELDSGVVGTGYVFAEVTSSIAGVVFEDSDGDGAFDSGETGIAGVTVTLVGTNDRGEDVTVSTVTGAQGGYAFTGLLSGDYALVETQPAGYQDGVDTAGTAGGLADGDDSIVGITLDEGEAATGYLFAEFRLSVIAGTVTDGSGNPIAGVEIELTGVDGEGNPVTDTTVTDADGTWTFVDVLPGTYTVTEVQPVGYADGPDIPGPAGGTATPPDSITGIVVASGVGAPGNQFIDLLGALAGVVFVDTNGNGAQDEGEPGLQGVLVTLAGVDDTGEPVTDSVVTDAQGGYVFTDLLSGDYEITEVQPAGYDDGIDTVGTAGGQLDGPDSIVGIALDEGEVGTGYDFGEVLLSGISGRVVDENGDGISDVELTLTGTDGAGNTITDFTFTGTDGSWAFLDLPPGTYTVTETQPVGYGDGPDTAGPGGGTATPPDSITGIVLASGGAAPGNVFVELLGSLGGSVYQDGNGSGTREEGELGIPGVLVTITGVDANGDDYQSTTVTSDDGSYLFDDLLGGTYTITETQPAGYADGIDSVGTEGGDLVPPDTIDAIQLDAAVDGSGYDFAELLLGSGISGVVVDEAGNGIANVQIDLVGTDGAGNTVTDTVFTGLDGTWEFADLPPGSYTVTETQPVGYGDGPDTPGPAGGRAVPPDSITGIVLVSGSSAPGNVFQEQRSSIAGVVYEDRNGNGTQDPGEPGIPGVTMELTGQDDAPGPDAPVDLTTVTADDGSYLFAGLLSGDYTLTQVQPAGYADGEDTPGTAGGVPVPPNSIVGIALGVAEQATGYLFADIANGVSGTVWVDTDADGVIDVEETRRVAGVTVIVRNAADVEVGRAVTDEQGSYNVPDLIAGTYTVEELQPAGYGSTTPNVVEVDVVAPGLFATANFGEELGQVGDFVWSDLDRDGIQDVGEPGIGGVTVILLNADGVEVARTTSADDGSYAFVDVPLGTYSIGAELPFGWSPTVPNRGGDTVDSDVDWVSYMSEPFDLVLSAEGRTTRDDTRDIGVVAESVDLTVDLTADTMRPRTGDRVTFAAVVSNAGTTPAFGAQVTLTVPAGFDIESVSGERWACVEADARTARCTTDQVLLPGESATRISMVTTARMLMNGATITAVVSTVGEQVDVNPVNNTDSLTVTVTAGSPGLPGTGAAVTGLLALAGLLLVGGAATILVTRRRRVIS